MFDIIYSFVHLFIQHSFSSDRVDIKHRGEQTHAPSLHLELRQMGETNGKQTYTNIYIQIVINAVKKIDYEKENRKNPVYMGRAAFEESFME